MGHFGCQRHSPANSFSVEGAQQSKCPEPGTAKPLLGLIAASMGSSAKSPARNVAGARGGWRSL